MLPDEYEQNEETNQFSVYIYVIIIFTL